MISFVIPALNESVSITCTVETCLLVASKCGLTDAEVIVVNDGSSDRTGELAHAAGARVINHPAPAGYGHSLKDGILAARHDTIVTLDADGTYPIERTSDLLADYKRGFDMVVGRRIGNHYRESAIKMPLRAVLRFMVEFTTGRPIPDVNSGFRVFSKNTSSVFFPRLSDRFSFSTSLTLAYLMSGKFVTYVDVDYGERVGQPKCGCCATPCEPFNSSCKPSFISTR